jgi:hypothetical protein
MHLQGELSKIIRMKKYPNIQEMYGKSKSLDKKHLVTKEKPI